MTSIAAQEATRVTIDAYLATATGTPGTVLLLLADACRRRGELANAAGAGYDEIAQWAVWADRAERALR